MISLHLAAEDLRAAVAAQGILYDGPIRLDGQFQHFDAAGDRPRSKKAWLKGYADGRPNGWFGHYARLPTSRWVFGGQLPQLRLDHDRIERERRARQEAQEAVDAAAAARAQVVLDAAQDAAAGPLHPYLSRKFVQAFGVFVGDWVKSHPDLPNGTLIVRKTLLIPVRREAKLWSLQGIFAEPISVAGAMRDKEFMRGCRAKGGYHAIGEPVAVDGQQVIIICEGYATGASIHMATGHFVLVAFHCGGLKPVAEFARRVRPNARIIIAADDDRWTEGNPGMRCARAAVEAVNGTVVVPEFPSLDSRPTDFNDLHVMAGLGEILAQVAAVGL
jgi:putative DNA primase/helicase